MKDSGQAGTIRKYYSLTKPGVLYGNAITSVAGFLLGASYFRQFHVGLFIAAIVGMTLIIASACVLNNVLDADIDALMERTRTRAMAADEIPRLNAVIFSGVLGILSLVILALWVNWLVFGVALAGFIIYVWLYGSLSKRRSVHGTLVGAISGAMPILAGYCAVSNRIDAAAVLVFLAIFFWQFPEFYSIAIYRRKEYKAAHVPVSSVVRGVKRTKLHILVHTVLFVASTLLLSILGYTGWIYFAVMAVLGLYFINLGIKGQSARDSDKWARQMFHVSLMVLLVYSGMIAIGPLLP